MRELDDLDYGNPRLWSRDMQADMDRMRVRGPNAIEAVRDAEAYRESDREALREAIRRDTENDEFGRDERFPLGWFVMAALLMFPAAIGIAWGVYRFCAWVVGVE